MLLILGLLLSSIDGHSNEWPVEFTKIEKINYERNPKAKFCKRPIEMVDTIVIHHSATPSTFTPTKINELHLERGTSDDPWYMIAYSYAINSPYLGNNIPRLKVSEGRPLQLVGAHAGSDAFIPMSDSQKKIWANGEVTCGRENEEFRVDSELIRGDKIKANVTTIGLVIIGNYSPFNRLNPLGFSNSNPQILIKSGQDLAARISCQLQKKYPGIKYLKWHNFYMPTICPGTIEKSISNIRNLTRKYGCNFN
jgi:hypothetical protein